MLNALWLNAQELNGSGQLYRVISLAATATAGATAAPPTLYRRIGLAAHVTSVISQSAALTRRAGMSAAVSGGAIAFPSNYMGPRVSLRSNVFTSFQGLFGASFQQHLAATANVQTSAIVGLGAKNMAATRTGGATVVAPVLTRTRMLAAHVTCGATQGSPTNILVTRNAYAHAYPGARASAEMDWKVGSVQYRGLAASVTPGASAIVVIDPKKPLAATLKVGATATVPPPQRTQALTGAPDLAGAITVGGPLRANKYLAATASAGATASNVLYRTVRFTPQAASVTAAPHLPPMLQYLARFYANASVSVAVAPPTIKQFSGLSAHVTAGAAVVAPPPAVGPKFYAYAYPQVSASDTMTVKPSVLLAATARVAVSGVATGQFKFQLAAHATTQISGNAGGYFTRVYFAGGTTLAQVSASARMSINLFDPEPDFRTYLVDADDWTLLVDAEDWTYTVTDDAA